MGVVSIQPTGRETARPSGGFPRFRQPSPVADPDGPYTAGIGETITLDGSGSYSPNGEFYPDPTHPWHGYIVSWEWDLDNDGAYDDATGETVPWSSSAVGLNVVGLKVTDNFDESDSVDTVVNVIPKIAIGIDIYPNRTPNRVFLSRNYTLYVAAMGSASFDATTLNSTTVKFGKTGAEASPVRAPLIRDLNYDGHLDAMYGFRTFECGFALGDTQGLLKGSTGDGTPVEGSDSVLVLP